jgi:hypothetical protein
VNLLVHDVEERKRGGENEDVDGGEQAEQKSYFPFARFGNVRGRIVFGDAHKFPASLNFTGQSSKKFPLRKTTIGSVLIWSARTSPRFETGRHIAAFQIKAVLRHLQAGAEIPVWVSCARKFCK